MTEMAKEDSPGSKVHELVPRSTWNLKTSGL